MLYQLTYQQTLGAERLSLGEFGKTSGSSVTFSIVKSGKSDDSSSFCKGIHTVPPSSASLPPWKKRNSLLFHRWFIFIFKDDIVSGFTIFTIFYRLCPTSNKGRLS